MVRADEAAAHLCRFPVAPVLATPEPLAQPVARILLLVSDQAVRHSMGLLLRVLGYRVTAHASLSAAMRGTRARDDFDLLIAEAGCGRLQERVLALAPLRSRLGLDKGLLLLAMDAGTKPYRLVAARTIIAAMPVTLHVLLEVLTDLAPQQTLE